MAGVTKSDKGLLFKGGRVIALKITLDEEDATALEVAAGATDKTPDEVLDELLVRSIQEQLKDFLNEIKKISAERLHPQQRAALQALGITREIERKRFTKRGA